MTKPLSLKIFLSRYNQLQCNGMAATDNLYPLASWEQWMENQEIFSIVCDSFVRGSEGCGVLVEQLSVHSKIKVLSALLSMGKSLSRNDVSSDNLEPIFEHCSGLVLSLPPAHIQIFSDKLSAFHKLPPFLLEWNWEQVRQKHAGAASAPRKI